MTDPTTTPRPDVAAPAPEPAAWWEDFIDILYAPSRVFERRRDASPWIPLLVVSALFWVINAFTYPALRPAYDAEFQRRAGAMIAQNPQMTPEIASTMATAAELSIRLGGGLLEAVSILAIGTLVWLLAMLFSAGVRWGTAVLIVAFASITDVVAALITGMQGLVANPVTLTSLNQLMVGPSRFLDPETTSPYLMTLLSRLNVFTLWFTALLAIGLQAAGRVPRGKAILMALTWWVLALLYMLRDAAVLARSRATP
jgi:hypothetical protein